jgi:hypothetical protein
MDQSSRPTGYARLTPRQARAVLALLVFVAGFFVAVTLSPLARGNVGKDRQEEGDIALFRAKVDRIHAGEGYYQAAAAELTARGYPTRSVFNWRTPLPMWLIGRLPAVVLGKAVLGTLALGLILTAFEALAREENNVIRRPVACAVLLTGPLMPCILGDLFVMPVLWAGVLIALSICAYGVDRPRLGVVFGLAAVFFRDLALPYCLLAAGFAWWSRRRGELTAWVLGLAAWAAFFALHWYRVADLITPQARAHSQGWLQFGSAGFVIATAQMNAYLLLLPQWFTALYLVAALCGFAGWQTPLGSRAGLTACLFVTAFAAAGHEFNQYWGSLIAPLLCFGVVRCPASLRDLWKAGRLTAVLGQRKRRAELPAQQ